MIALSAYFTTLGVPRDCIRATIFENLPEWKAGGEGRELHRSELFPLLALIGESEAGCRLLVEEILLAPGVVRRQYQAPSEAVEGLYRKMKTLPTQ